MADVRWLARPKRSTVVYCGVVMIVSSLSFSLLLASFVTDSASDSPEGTVKLARWDGGYRNILDVRNVDVGRAVQADYSVDVKKGEQETTESKQYLLHSMFAASQQLFRWGFPDQVYTLSAPLLTCLKSCGPSNQFAGPSLV